MPSKQFCVRAMNYQNKEVNLMHDKNSSREKEQYVPLEVEVLSFEPVDIISTSTYETPKI